MSAIADDDRWLSLRIAPSWRFRLAFESPLPEARALAWRCRGNRLHVVQGSRTVAETDGQRGLRLGSRTFRAGRRRWLSEADWLRPADAGFGFRLAWGRWCAARDDAFEGVRIEVEGRPEERYLARCNAPRWQLRVRTRVTVHATGDAHDVDRMAGLLAYFWADAHARQTG